MQAGVLEIHTRGTTNEHREEADRLVFDLDPGPDVNWREVIAAAREVRALLVKLKLKTFIKTTGGKGLHVVLPIKPTPWDEAKAFAKAVAEAMAAHAPDRYLAVSTIAKRQGRIFIDYLRNSREATAVAPYSTRARAGRRGVDADRLVRAWQPQERRPIHRREPAAAIEAPAQGPLGRHRPHQAGAAQSTISNRPQAAPNGGTKEPLFH